MDMPVYVIENQPGRRQTLHWNQLFLVKRINSEQDCQIAARLFEVASTQIGCEVPHQKMYKAGTPLIEVQAGAASLLDIDPQDAQVLKLWKLIASACRALRTIFAGWWLKKEWASESYCVSSVRYIMGGRSVKWIISRLIGLITASHWRLTSLLLRNFMKYYGRWFGTRTWNLVFEGKHNLWWGGGVTGAMSYPTDWDEDLNFDLNSRS